MSLQTTIKPQSKTVGEEERNKYLPNNHKTTSTVAVSSCLSIITLNINELNPPLKRHQVNVWIKQ
jgi:hypothetical protein